MIQMQDVTVFDMPIEVQAQEQRIAELDRTYNLSTSNSAYTYKYETKKPKIVQPKTTAISPMVIYLTEKLRQGNPQEQKRALVAILQGLNKKKGSAQYLDSGLTDALFFVIDQDTSKMQGPTRQQLRYRKQLRENKRLPKEKIDIAVQLSEKEMAERNKAYSLYLVAKIQSELCNQIADRTGLQPKVNDLPIVQRLIKVSQTNKDENIRGAALGALALLNRPEFEQDLSVIFSKAANSNDKIIKEYAERALKSLSEGDPFEE